MLSNVSSALPQWDWQPSDAFEAALPGIAAQLQQAGCANVRAPVLLDVRDASWPSRGPAFDGPFDLVYCANMIHIAPWECCGALMRGASGHLAANGRLVLYVEHYLNPTYFPGILEFDLTRSLTELYASHYGIYYGRVRFDILPTALPAVAASATAAAALDQMVKATPG